MSHDVAMASDTMASRHANAAVHIDADRHGTHDACAVSGCEESGAPCCIMGHCLLGIPLAAECQFEVAVAPDLEAVVLPGRAAGVVRTPFRPPALV